MILAALIAGMLHPLPQTNWDIYQQCMGNFSQSGTYCCAQANGIWESGTCVDSATGHVPWPCPDGYRICGASTNWWPK